VSSESQYLILTRWMSRRGLLRSLCRCCLGLVALLVAGGAAESHTGSHARVHLRFAFQTFEGMEGS
jgi:hypothetical protein